MKTKKNIFNYKWFLKKYTLIIIIFFLVFIISLILFKPNLNNVPNSTIIFDINSQKIWEILPQNNIRHEFIKISEIPDFSKKVIISIEDKNFYKNFWIDFYALFRSLKSNLLNWKISQWASTISTQVIRNSYWLNSDRTFLKKIIEFYLAISLNLHYSKDEILENYLNNIYFWNLNYGLNSASRYYFWKELKNLTKAEQIALLIIPKNANKYSPVKNRFNFYSRFKIIVNYLENNWIINKSEKQEIENEKLNFNKENQIILPYVIDFLKSRNNLWTVSLNSINTTINYNLTKKIDEIAKNTIIPLKWKWVWDYWILIVDRKTNEIKVLIWWEDYSIEWWQVNSVLALRQPGSAIKPFTYLLAFRDLWLTPESTIIDEPVQFFTDKWYAYTPENYSLDYKWKVSLAEALSQSINIPAVKLVNKVWIKNLLNFLKEVWITSLNKDSDYYWLALTLWVWEVNLYELLRGYSIFANDWNLCDFKILNNPPLFKGEVTKEQGDYSKNCKKIADKKYIAMVESILTNRYFKLAWFPINSSLDFSDRYVFVKTWTSRNFNDNWAMWFTSNYLIWVWVWNKGWEEMKWVSWATWAWEIFRNIVYEIENEQYYNKGTKLEKNSEKFLEITSPLNWSLYKIDETKPLNIQNIKLEFSSNIDYDGYFWIVNGNKIDWNIFNIKEWTYEISINLESKWKIISSKKTKINIIK